MTSPPGDAGTKPLNSQLFERNKDRQMNLSDQWIVFVLSVMGKSISASVSGQINPLGVTAVKATDGVMELLSTLFIVFLEIIHNSWKFC